MALQTLNTIKQWFKTGLKPSQQQFWDTWDSFRHKYEKVPVKDVDGIDELLLSKADKIVLDNHLADQIAHAPQINTDWNSQSGFSQLINKPEFKTINGEPILGTGDITLDVEGLTFEQVLSNGNETTQTALFKSYSNSDVYTNAISGRNIEMTQSSTATRGENKTASLTLSSELIDFVNSNTGQTTALFAQGVGFGNLNSNHFSTLGMNPATTANYSTVLMPAITTEEETKTLATLDDIPTFLPVSATRSGIVDNTSLQELGGVDKLIRNVRIGKGAGTVSGSTVLGDTALNLNTTGTYNTAMGSSSLRNNTTGVQSTAVGAFSLYKNTTGGYNTAVGQGALQENTTAIANTALGQAALQKNTTGEYNTAIGNGSGTNLTSGSWNTLVGSGSGGSATPFSFSRNTAVGYRSLVAEGVSGGNNTVIGNQAGANITSGSGNIMIGSFNSIAGTNITTGNKNIILSVDQVNTGLTTGSGNVLMGLVTGLDANSTNTMILADGSGNKAFVKNTNGETLAPSLTNALINSGGAKSLITKEYIDETKQIKDKQKIINGDIDVQENWNGQTIIFKSSGVVRMPIINTEEFSFNAITLEGVNLTWQWANQIEWIFGEPESTPEKKYFNLTKLGNTNQIILSV